MPHPNRARVFRLFWNGTNVREKAYYNEFMKLNEKRLRGKEELRLGVKYVLPPLKKGTSASVSPKAVAGKKRVVRERLFGKKLADVTVTSNRLQGACFYVVSGHGGPDPGAIGKIGKVELHEDEYAYDVALRLARNLMQEGRKSVSLSRMPKTESVMANTFPTANVRRAWELHTLEPSSAPPATLCQNQ